MPRPVTKRRDCWVRETTSMLARNVVGAMRGDNGTDVLPGTRMLYQ